MKLTRNQMRFVNEYLLDLNATKAYKAAYPSVKKDETAAAAASRLLRNVKVKAHLGKRIKDREKRTEITQDRVLNELAKIGFVDLADYAAFRTEKTVVGHQENGDPILGYKPIIDIKPSDKVDGAAIQQVSLTDKGTLSFKLQDKVKALELLGRHLGMWNDKLDITTDITLDFGGDEDVD